METALGENKVFSLEAHKGSSSYDHTNETNSHHGYKKLPLCLLPSSSCGPRERLLWPEPHKESAE